jgi:hypothetical protein
VTASETNAAGLTGTAYLSFTYDTVAPQAPSAPQLALGSDVADTSTPVFSGTAEANDEVVLLEGDTVIGTGTASENGSWDIQTEALDPGYHNVSAEVVDAAGNNSPLSAATTIEVAPSPPGEVTLSDSAMIADGDASVVGTVTGSANETLTEYGPISSQGFTLTDLSRSAFSFVSWSSDWASLHDVNGVDEYYDGASTLIVPSDGIVALGSGNTEVQPSIADTIDLEQANGAPFSLVSIDIGPTGDAATSAVFTGTTANGQTITETFNLSLPENSALQPVALTGFNDVTDVKFTEDQSEYGDPTSVEFDNIVLGNAEPPPPPPTPTPLTAPVTLDDATLVQDGAAPLVSSYVSVQTEGNYSDFGAINYDGFSVTNLSRSDYSFISNDSKWDAIEGYFYNGSDTFNIPFDESGANSIIQIERNDGGAFSIDSIGLDTLLDTLSATATFTGATAGGGTVTQTFEIDDTPGLQTFVFSAQFDDLTSLQFTGSEQLEFNDIVLSPPIPDTPTGLQLIASSDTGVPGDGVTALPTPQITGTGDSSDTVTL